MTPDGFMAVYTATPLRVRAIEQPNPARLQATVKAVASGADASTLTRWIFT